MDCPDISHALESLLNWLIIPDPVWCSRGDHVCIGACWIVNASQLGQQYLSLRQSGRSLCCCGIRISGFLAQARQCLLEASGEILEPIFQLAIPIGDEFLDALGCEVTDSSCRDDVSQERDHSECPFQSGRGFVGAAARSVV
jgi:hypothetical protein